MGRLLRWQSNQGWHACDYTEMRTEAKIGVKKQGLTESLKWSITALSLVFILCGAPGAGAQETSPSKPESVGGEAPANPAKQEKIPAKAEHRFWDKENDWLFAGVGASRTLDYFST